jgi:hypothetical protein
MKINNDQFNSDSISLIISEVKSYLDMDVVKILFSGDYNFFEKKFIT